MIRRYEDLGYDEYSFWIDSGMSAERKRACNPGTGPRRAACVAPLRSSASAISSSPPPHARPAWADRQAARRSR